MKCCFSCEDKCCLTWLSGFFGFGAVIHLLRIIFKIKLVVHDFYVPLRLSAAAVILLGGLSILLCWLGCNEKNKEEIVNK